jgi:transcriptional regulator with PAS, ATPase and Fis domain
MNFHTRNEEMQRLLDEIRKMAPTDHTVLIQGESGTGKELLAQQIHRLSRRAGGPFIKVDCATIPESLWESELFGYAPGAFTGAHRDGKAGKFRLADGGTIFLDEIGDVPLPIQVKLLRVLQDHAFDPIGSVRTERVDVRILAATNRDLAAARAASLFREDLFFRLNQFSVTIPPLRDRKEDIELLTQHFLSRYGSPGVSGEVVAALLLYSWPGNVRELENALARAAVLAGPGSQIQLRHLPPEVAGSLAPPPPRQVYRRYIKSAERLILQWGLGECKGDRTKAARFLGLSRAALYKKLNQYPDLKEYPRTGT